MELLIAVSRGLDAFVTRVGKWAAWLLLPMMAVIIIDVITRKFGLLTVLRDGLTTSGADGSAKFVETYLTSTKFQELEWHLHAALFLLCLAFGYTKNSHVRIEIVRERFDRQTKAWLEVIGCVFFVVPYASLVLYFGMDFAERSFSMNEVSSALTGLSHRWIIKSFVPIGMVLLLMGTVAVLLRNLVFLFGPKNLQDEAYNMAMELHRPEDELRMAKEALANSKKAE